MDPPITELGQQQSEILAKNQATDAIQDLIAGAVPGSAGALEKNGYGVTSLFCSPMLGSVQTAHPVQEALGLILEVWVDIHERGGMFLDHGEGRGSLGYPGMARSEISAKYPNRQLPPGIAEEGWWDRGREDPPTACVWAEPHGMSFAELLHEVLIPTTPRFYTVSRTSTVRIDFY